MLGKTSATWGRAKLVTMRATRNRSPNTSSCCILVPRQCFPSESRQCKISSNSACWPSVASGATPCPPTPCPQGSWCTTDALHAPFLCCSRRTQHFPRGVWNIETGAVSEGHWDSHLSKTKERTLSLKLKYFPTPGDKLHAGCIPGKEYSRPKAHSCVSEQDGRTVAVRLTIMCDMPPLQSYLRLLYC